MSSIAFHSIERTIQIGGRERGFMGQMVERIFRATLNVKRWLGFGHPKERDVKIVCSILPPKHYLHSTSLNRPRSEYIEQDLETALHVGVDHLIIDGEEIDAFEVKLNTALVMGSDLVRLNARIHGQCEVHGYVEGPNREWLAELVERGLETGIMRYETQGYEGWEALPELLRERDDAPVVMSYSVSDDWPRMWFPGDWDGWTEEQIGRFKDRWHDMTREERWEDALARVRKLNEDGADLELKPETLGKLFGAEKTAFDIAKYWARKFDELEKTNGSEDSTVNA